MLTRCRKGLIIVSSKSFLHGGGEKTLLGKLEQQWVTRPGGSAWVDWRQVAEGKSTLPHSRDTVTTGRTVVDSGTTSAPAPDWPPLPTVPSPPKLPHSRDTVTTGWREVYSGTSIATPAPYLPPASSLPKLPKNRSLPVREQTSWQTWAKVVSHGSQPTFVPHASAPVQPPLKAPGTKERQRSTTTSGTPRHVYNHTPVQVYRHVPDDSDEDPSSGGWGFWEWAGLAAAAYIGFRWLRPRQ